MATANAVNLQPFQGFSPQPFVPTSPAAYFDANGTFVIQNHNAASGNGLRIDSLNAQNVATASFTISNSGAWVIGDDSLFAFGTDSEARFSWDTTDANANELLLQMPAGTATNVPVLVIGQGVESVDLGLYNGVVDPRIAMFGVGAVTTGPIVEFRKARGTVASPTAVTSGDDMGTLDFYAAVAAGEYVRGASIRADAAGTIATTRGPGNLSFNVATDAAPSVMTERLLITASGQINATPATDWTFADATGVIVGHTAQVTMYTAAEIEMLGTADPDTTFAIGRWSADASGPTINLGKSRAAAIGTATVVQADDELGQIIFTGADGTDHRASGAIIRCLVDGTPGTGDMPSRIAFYTSADGSESPVEAMRIDSAQAVTLGVAGTRLGVLKFSGNTSGVITMNGAAAAGTWTFTLPPDDGDAGEQLQTNGSGVTTWEAAGSLREFKNIRGLADAGQALKRILGTSIYDWTYKRPEESPIRLTTTGDHTTIYTGVVADDAPWAMHHNGRIFNPVSAFGHTALAIQALVNKIQSAKSLSALQASLA